VRAVDTIQATAHRPPPPATTTVRRRTSLDTPRRLILGAVGGAVLVAALAGALLSGDASARGGLATLSARTGEVDATNDLYLRLNDMDAQAANALLIGFHPTMSVPAADSAATALATYQADRAAASGDLQAIAPNPALAARYRSLLDALGSYEGLVAQAVYVDQNTPDERPAAPPAAALSLYLQATAQMHAGILPIAAGITAQDSAAVDAAYSGNRAAIERDAVLVALLGLLTVAAFAAANAYLTRRFRRLLTPALLLAAVVAAATAAGGSVFLAHEAGRVRTAKSEAFDSINALTDARAVSYDANADESRWLLDPTAALQQSFFTQASRIAAVPGLTGSAAAADPPAYYAGLAHAAAGLNLDKASNTVSDAGLGGYLGTELRNITFPGEAQAADQATRAFSAFLQADQSLRAKENSGGPAAAVSFDIGTAPGQSDYAFYQYDSALRSVIAINQNGFRTAVAAGQSASGLWTWLPYASAAALLALIAVAVYPRLREYR
jgi:hypothetical protein